MGTFNVKTWNGSSFVDSQNVKVWNGSSWVDQRPVRVWNGSSWVDKMTYSQVYETTFNATWSTNYNDGGDENVYYPDRMYQGYYSSSRGVQKSMVGFDGASIRSALSGARILQIQLYLANIHWYYVAGGYAYIGTHNSAGKPNTFTYSTYQDIYPYYNGRGSAQWNALPVYVGERFRDNLAQGFTLFASTTSMAYYGYFKGTGSDDPPRLWIQYEK